MQTVSIEVEGRDPRIQDAAYVFLDGAGWSRIVGLGPSIEWQEQNGVENPVRTITAIDEADDSTHEVDVKPDEKISIEIELLEASDCLDFGPTGKGCRGPVRLYRFDDRLRSFPRCEVHAERRAKAQEEINARYGGDLPPADFDPAYAGESWEEV